MLHSASKPSRRKCIELYSSGPVRIRYSQGTGTHLVVSFASIGRRRIEMPPDEFMGTLLNRPELHCIFISDLDRSWMNGALLREKTASCVDRIVSMHSISNITTLGVSMGGFSALVASELFPVTTAIAISPQYSIARNIMPNETRWRFWRKNISKFVVETADVNPAADHTFIFHGLVDDILQMDAFPEKKNCDHFVFPNKGHSKLGQFLKDEGVLPSIIIAGTMHERKAVAKLVKSHGGMWRGRYEKQVTRR